MSESTEKSWNRAWTLEEVIDNASNWSLAGDAGLLKYLESFSDNLLAKAKETNNNVTTLLDNLNKASLSLDIVKNEFGSLRNTQFIESRVYEDDETLVSEENSSENDKKMTEEEKLQDIKEAIMVGIDVVNKHYDKIEVPVSDTEDETDFPNFVLRPKDPYIDRPLPYVIGSEKWYKKWHVGLLDSSSDSEVDKVSEKFSESDSDDEVPVTNKNEIQRYSNSESETDMFGINIKIPVANSTFDEDTKHTDILGSSDSEEYNTIQTPKTFAQELATKLGNVADQSVNVIEAEINRKPIMHQRGSSIGNLFSDEPPPIDDDELFGNTGAPKRLFSDGGGLFDDLDSSYNSEKSRSIVNQTPNPKVLNLFDDYDDDDIFTSNPENNTNKNQEYIPKTSRGLFDEDDDDDLFGKSTSNNNLSSKSYLEVPNKPTVPFFDEEPPELESSLETKKPVGGVKVFGKSDLLSSQKIQQDSSESSIIPPIIDSKKETRPKQLSLFDDDDIEFEDDLFSNMSVKKFTSSLFDKEPLDVTTKEEPSEPSSKTKEAVVDDSESDDLFSKNTPVPQKLKDTGAQSLSHISFFDQNPPELDENWDAKSNNLFIDNDNDDGGLFDNIPEISSVINGVFDNEPPSLFNESSGIIRDASTSARVEADDSFKPDASSSRRFSTDIFNEQQSNDSFFVTKNKSEQDSRNLHSHLDSIPEIIHKDSTSILEITPSGNLDDLFSDYTVSVDAKIDNTVSDKLQTDLQDYDLFSDTNMFHSNENPKERHESNLASKYNVSSTSDVKVEQHLETPKVVPTSIKIGSPGKLKHNLNINVNALMPGASPPKRKELEKSHSLEVPSSNEDDITQISVNSSTQSKSDEDMREQNNSQINTTFDSQTGAAEILPSITKDRVRIPVKRRPSTRKARHESIRKSVPDFKIVPTTSNIAETKKTEHIVSEKDKSTESFFDIFDENEVDIFSEVVKIPSSTSSEVGNRPKSPQPRTSVINSDSFESSDFKKSDLFEDSEEFDDIFSSKMLPPKSNILKTSLFEDDDDDDDIFGPIIPEKSKSFSLTKTENKLPKVAHVKKLKNMEAVDDPLSSFIDK